MRELIISAAAGAAVFLLCLMVAIGLSYYVGISSGAVFGTPEFGRYTEAAMIFGGAAGLILGGATIGVIVEAF